MSTALHPSLQDALTPAMRLHAAGDLDKARTAYLALLPTYPEEAELHFLLGSIYMQQGSGEQALEYFQQAAKLQPKQPRYQQRLAELAEQMQHVHIAIDALVALLEITPNNIPLTEKLLNLAINNKRYDPAKTQLKRLLLGAPDDAALLHLICLCYTEEQAFVEGLPYFSRAYRAKREQGSGFLKAYATALHRAGRIDDALDVLAEAARQHPHDDEIYVMMAANHNARSEHAKSIDAYDLGLKANPGHPTLQPSKGLMRLMLSHMKEGYDDYFLRHQAPKARPFYFPLPWWQGEPLAGKRLVLWAEQGVGDLVMFATLLPWIIAQKPKHLCVAMYPKLQPIMRRAFPEIEVCDLALSILENAEERFDYHQAMGELMHYVLPHYTPAEHACVLKAEPERTAQLRARYEALAHERGARRIVGIAWHTTNADTGYLRNIPIAKWKPLLSIADVQYVSLQYGDHPDTLAEANAIREGCLFADTDVDQFNSTDDALAQVAAMDEIITIQNATAHFGGALGIPTELLLSSASDWRWGLEHDRSLWYPSVHINRQAQMLQWEDLLEQQATRLMVR